tara:strand:- start:559 stop:2121 length:1563 start_codon:yes stop_codon:yes gene_type:complete
MNLYSNQSISQQNAHTMYGRTLTDTTRLRANELASAFARDREQRDQGELEEKAMELFKHSMMTGHLANKVEKYQKYKSDIASGLIKPTSIVDDLKSFKVGTKQFFSDMGSALTVNPNKMGGKGLGPIPSFVSRPIGKGLEGIGAGITNTWDGLVEVFNYDPNGVPRGHVVKALKGKVEHGSRSSLSSVNATNPKTTFHPPQKQNAFQRVGADARRSMTISDGASTLDLTPGSVGAPRHKTADMFGRLSQQTDVSEQIKGLDLRGDVRRTLKGELGGNNSVLYRGDQLTNTQLRTSGRRYSEASISQFSDIPPERRHLSYGGKTMEGGYASRVPDVTGRVPDVTGRADPGRWSLLDDSLGRNKTLPSVKELDMGFGGTGTGKQPLSIAKQPITVGDVAGKYGTRMMKGVEGVGAAVTFAKATADQLSGNWGDKTWDSKMADIGGQIGSGITAIGLASANPLFSIVGTGITMTTGAVEDVAGLFRAEEKEHELKLEEEKEHSRILSQQPVAQLQTGITQMAR